MFNDISLLGSKMLFLVPRLTLLIYLKKKKKRILHKITRNNAREKGGRERVKDEGKKAGRQARRKGNGKKRRKAGGSWRQKKEEFQPEGCFKKYVFERQSWTAK